MGNGITETTSFDNRVRMTGRIAGSVYRLSDLSYEPDGDVYVATETGNGGSSSYHFDGLNRLVSSSNPAVGNSYGYDRRGNRWSQGILWGAGPSWSQAFDANNHVVGYAYDAAGNLQSDGNCSYSYDAGNELIAVGGGGCAAASYVYDAEGRRVRTVTSNTEDTLFDLAGHPAAVLGAVNGTSQWWWRELSLGGRHLAIYEGGTTNFAHPDGLGTGRAWSTLAGASLATCSSLPFGDGFACSPGGPSPSHFTGQVHDAESGLDYFNARHYSASQGRFLSPDPLGFGAANPNNPASWNQYAYTGNNPVNFTDPSGMDECASNNPNCLIGWQLGDLNCTLDGISTSCK